MKSTKKRKSEKLKLPPCLNEFCYYKGGKSCIHEFSIYDEAIKENLVLKYGSGKNGRKLTPRRTFLNKTNKTEEKKVKYASQETNAQSFTLCQAKLVIGNVQTEILDNQGSIIYLMSHYSLPNILRYYPGIDVYRNDPRQEF